MLQKFFIGLAIKFGLRAWLKFEDKIQWALVKQNLAERVRKLIPGDFIDDEAVMLMEKTVDVLDSIFGSQDFLAQVIDLVKAGKAKDVLALLKQAILDKYLPNRDLAMSEDESLLMAIKSA